MINSQVGADVAATTGSCATLEGGVVTADVAAALAGVCALFEDVFGWNRVVDVLSSLSNESSESTGCSFAVLFTLSSS